MATYKYSSWSFGQVEALLNILGGDDVAKKVLAGTVKVTVEVLSHIVDGDADPFLPDGWEVEKHKKQGEMKITRASDDLYVNGKKIEFFLSKPQEKGETIVGNDLRKELNALPVLNANVLDYLLAHPELIPDEWKKDTNGNTRYIFFWGTIYGDSDGHLRRVRCLYWLDGRWRWNDFWLDDGWGTDSPAALLASQSVTYSKT